MKELTIEEKAKAYDETIEKLRNFHRDYDIVSGLIDVKEELANLFPELKEDEDGDEKTRKDIVFYIAENHKDDGEKARWLYWLEKQGDKSVNIDIESMVSSYKQRLKSQGGIENSTLVNMCLTAFRRGVENTLEELNLKKLEKKGEQKSSDKVEPIVVRDFNSVFSREQIEEIDKRIEESQRLYNAKLRDAMRKVEDFQMTD
jgi:hypothetical protein